MWCDSCRAEQDTKHDAALAALVAKQARAVPPETAAETAEAAEAGHQDGDVGEDEAEGAVEQAEITAEDVVEEEAED